MNQTIGHLRRLYVIAQTLARHDALELLDHPLTPAVLAWPLRYFKWRYGGASGRNGKKRPGERLAAALYDLGPSFIKLGQALSVRPDIVGEELAADLSHLRDRLPEFSAAEARKAIAAEFGRDVGALFQSFDDAPVAAASIAQVHFAVTAEGREVAVKILRPGIEDAFRRDLELMHWLAPLLEPYIRRLRPVEVVATLANTVAMELDLRFEAAAASELAENFQDDPDFRVPKVDWLRTGRRVLTLNRVHALPIDDRAGLIAAGHNLPELAARIIRTFLKQSMRDGFFHADLHQGNLFVAADGAIEAVDFGIMGRLEKPTRRFMAELLLAFVTGDYRRAAEVHFEAGYVPAQQSVDAFAQALRSVGEPILGRPVNEISIGRLLAHLFRITAAFAMPTQPQLLLLQKTMVTAEGVARTLDPEVNFWSVSKPVIEAWIADEAGPDAKLRDVSATAVELIERLPGLAFRFERAIGRIAEGGLRLDQESVRELAAENARTRRPLVWGLWALAFLVLILIFAVS